MKMGALFDPAVAVVGGPGSLISTKSQIIDDASRAAFGIEDEEPEVSLAPPRTLTPSAPGGMPSQGPRLISDEFRKMLSEPPQFEPPSQYDRPSVKGALKRWGMSMIPGYEVIRGEYQASQEAARQQRNAIKLQEWQRARELAMPYLTRDAELENELMKTQQRMRLLRSNPAFANALSPRDIMNWAAGHALTAPRNTPEVRLKVRMKGNPSIVEVFRNSAGDIKFPDGRPVDVSQVEEWVAEKDTVADDRMKEMSAWSRRKQGLPMSPADNVLADNAQARLDFEAAGRAPSDTDLAFADWKKKPGNATKDRADFMAYSKTMVPAFTFNQNNPGLTDDQVKWYADQVSPGEGRLGDLSILPMLTRTNKRAHKQVTDELASRGEDVTKLTAAQKDAAVTASKVMRMIDKVRWTLEDPKKAEKIGPAIGRWNSFMAGTVGKGDRDFQYIRDMVNFIKTGGMRMHFGSRGGIQMYEHFTKMLNAERMDMNTLAGAMAAFYDVAKGYANPHLYDPDEKGGTTPSSAIPQIGPNSTGVRVLPRK